MDILCAVMIPAMRILRNELCLLCTICVWCAQWAELALFANRIHKFYDKPKHTYYMTKATIYTYIVHFVYRFILSILFMYNSHYRADMSWWTSTFTRFSRTFRPPQKHIRAVGTHYGTCACSCRTLWYSRNKTKFIFRFAGIMLIAKLLAGGAVADQRLLRGEFAIENRATILCWASKCSYNHTWAYISLSVCTFALWVKSLQESHNLWIQSLYLHWICCTSFRWMQDALAIIRFAVPCFNS